QTTQNSPDADASFHLRSSSDHHGKPTDSVHRFLPRVSAVKLSCQQISMWVKCRVGQSNVVVLLQIGSVMKHKMRGSSKHRRKTPVDVIPRDRLVFSPN